MTTNISNAFISMFDEQVKKSYQARRQLGGLIREKTGVVGTTVRFQLIGKGIAQTRNSLQDFTPLQTTYSTVTATMQDFIAGDYTDLFHAPKINFSERQELVDVTASAIGRRYDQLIMDALSASSGTGTVAKTIQDDGSSGSAVGLNSGMIREAKRILDKNNVPPNERCLLIHANSLAQLLSNTSVTSADFNSVRALVSGSVDSWHGFRIVTVGDYDEGGLALGSSERVVYAFHKSALGIGIGMNQTSKIDYVPEKVSFMVASMFSGGAIAIDPLGIVKITHLDS